MQILCLKCTKLGGLAQGFALATLHPQSKYIYLARVNTLIQSWETMYSKL